MACATPSHRADKCSRVISALDAVPINISRIRRNHGAPNSFNCLFRPDPKEPREPRAEPNTQQLRILFKLVQVSSLRSRRWPPAAKTPAPGQAVADRPGRHDAILIEYSCSRAKTSLTLWRRAESLNASETRKPPDQQMIVVAVAADQSYAVGAAVTIASLADHVPKDLGVELWLLHIGLDKAQLGLIASVAARGGVHLHAVELLPGQLSLPNQSDYISGTTFARLYLGEILPPDRSRVLYLDCDLLVTGDLQDLWSTDLRGRILAAVSEPTQPVLANPRTYQRLHDRHLDPSMPYFNAGVLMIDLDAWRRAHIGDRALSYLAQHRPPLMDQDALNAVVSGRWLELDPMWNVITYWFRSRTRQRRYEAILRRARIIHYVGHRKPWLRDDVWEARRWLRYRRQLAGDLPEAIGAPIGNATGAEAKPTAAVDAAPRFRPGQNTDHAM